jgi:hypothetical protein
MGIWGTLHTSCSTLTLKSLMRVDQATYLSAEIGLGQQHPSQKCPQCVTEAQRLSDHGAACVQGALSADACRNMAIMA